MNTENFTSYHLSDEILKAINLMNYTKPTHVQMEVMPHLLEHKDIIVKSQTGSGKTASFAIPICDMVKWDENKPQALVLTPTRELAIQVKDDFFHLGRFKRLKVAALYGKSPFYLQEKEIKQKTHIVVATPGRLIDHMDRETIDLSEIKYLVIDEADEMLKMGFFEQVETILKLLPKDRVTVVLSATMPENIKSLCERTMKSPVFVEMEEQDPVVDRILQSQIEVSESDKMSLLENILIVENPDSVIIFCNTQSKVDEVYETLESEHFIADKIHGGMEQNDRIKVMDRFRLGKFRYLVATDVAARGIDIDQIELVINYDVPNRKENYVHRIGRTGRVENSGKAITFVSNQDRRLLKDVHELIGNEIPKMKMPTSEEIEFARAAYDEKISIIPETKMSKGHQINEGILKLHINAGKKTKMRAVDIVGTICSIEGVEAEDIGIINIMDISTYVEILNHKGELVYKVLQEKPIKGRIRRVSKKMSE